MECTHFKYVDFNIVDKITGEHNILRLSRSTADKIRKQAVANPKIRGFIIEIINGKFVVKKVGWFKQLLSKIKEKFKK